MSWQNKFLLRLLFAAWTNFMVAPSTLAAETRLRSGDAVEWTLAFNIHLVTQDKKVISDLSITGDWASTITDVRPDDYDAALQLLHLQLRGDPANQASERAISGLKARLSRRFWATYRKDGVLLSTHFLKDVDPSERNLLQMIAAQAQAVIPEADRQPIWTVMERDGAGAYLALYQRTDATTIVKRKLKYVDTDGAISELPDQLRLHIEESRTRVLLDSAGALLALSGRESVRMGGHLQEWQILSDVEFELTMPRKKHAPKLAASLDDMKSSIVTFPIMTHRLDPKQVQRERDDRLLAVSNTETLLGAADTGADPALRERLSALFRRHPDSIDKAITSLRVHGPQRRITEALASAERPEAIEGLGVLARDPALPAQLRVDSLIALIRVADPSAACMAIPMPLMNDENPGVSTAARIVGGALARAGRKKNEREAAEIDARLIAQYQGATDAEEITGLLSALGNSVGPSVVSILQDALKDPRGFVRAGAARSLRLASGSSVDQLLSETMESDPDPNVRSSAIFAAKFRRPIAPVIIRALARAAREDSTEYVRSEAVVLLKDDPDSSDQTAEALRWVAAHDESPGMRRLAREALGGVTLTN